MSQSEYRVPVTGDHLAGIVQPRRGARWAISFGLALALGVIATAQDDLNDFMRQVMARRDDNWRTLQQFVLDERERLEIRGPTHTTLWGEERDYTWFIRDGFFVRSPLAVNGSRVSDNDRQQYERNYLERERRRETRAQSSPSDRGPASPPQGVAPSPELDSIIQQTRQPQFISSAYFFNFKFDDGRYALVGRERLGRQEVLRIEYYPRNLFDERGRRSQNRDTEPSRQRRRSDEALSAELRRLMNASSKVTLWIEPQTKQIVKYDFDDLGWDFFPGQWLLRMTGVDATMTMTEAFPSVWLPGTLSMHIGMQMALGPIELDYGLEYHDYRKPDVDGRLVPGPP